MAQARVQFHIANHNRAYIQYNHTISHTLYDITFIIYDIVI